jgi:hypothetical protein
MASPLVNRMRVDGPRIFYTEGFRRELEAHLGILKTRVNKQIKLDDNIALRYQFDFFGLLTYLDIPNQYHWITMRFNNFLAPHEFTKTHNIISIPDVEFIETLRAIYNTSHVVL